MTNPYDVDHGFGYVDWDEVRKALMDTRPKVGVLHEHDGSCDAPVPVGTYNTHWAYGEPYSNTLDQSDDWSMITQYLVHSYPPKTTTKTGTVTYTNGEPDFETWVADDE